MNKKATFGKISLGSGTSRLEISGTDFDIGFFNETKQMTFYNNEDEIIGIFIPIDPSYDEIVAKLKGE